MEKKKLRWQLPVLFLFIITTIFILRRQTPYQENQGKIFGTIYHAIYQYPDNLQKEIEAELKKVDNSLSPFNEMSVITRINRNEDVIPDSLLIEVVSRSQKISTETDGAFDITIAPLANVWGFGFKKSMFPDSTVIDSLLEITGYNKIKLEKGKLIKKDPRIMISCSAVAKGYGSDVIARFLEHKGIQNYMIEIGGEVVVKGTNPKNTSWHIGISKPVDDSLSINQELQTVLKITDAGMATSGNYRNFYYKDGKKYAHTIDPRTGYPVQHALLSATVIASDCMSADAYATAFMVMGLEEAEKFANAHPDIEAFFIYTDNERKTQTRYTNGMKKYLIEQ